MTFQAYIDNIQAKTGKTPADFQRLARAKGLMTPDVKAVKLEGPETFLAVGKPFVFPQPVKKAEEPKPAAEAPPPPITLKYYGLATKRIDGKKTAFFLDGEEIILAPEGYTVKKKYRVVRIGVNSVLMEDMDSKRQQSLPLVEDTGNASE